MKRYYELTIIPSIALGSVSTIGLNFLGWYQGQTTDTSTDITRLIVPFIFFITVMSIETGMSWLKEKLPKIQ